MVGSVLLRVDGCADPCRSCRGTATSPEAGPALRGRRLGATGGGTGGGGGEGGEEAEDGRAVDAAGRGDGGGGGMEEGTWSIEKPLTSGCSSSILLWSSISFGIVDLAVIVPPLSTSCLLVIAKVYHM